jgi:hypothetical protein
VNTTLRKQITREFPELAAGYHLPIMAEVLAIPDAPTKGGINDSYRPRLAVNVVLLDSNYKNTGILIDAVPMAIMGGGNERGFFAMPQKGTIVELAWLNGSPERPFIRSVLGDRQALPWIDEHTMAWQQDESTKQTVDGSGNWNRETPATITDKSHTRKIDAQEKIETLGNEIKRILQHSLEDIDGIKRIEAGAIHSLSMSVSNILALGSINLVSTEHITRSATKNIADKAAENLSQDAKNIKQLAETNLELIAAKIHLGKDGENLLAVFSEFMQAVQDGFTALSSTPILIGAMAPVIGPPPYAADAATAATGIGSAKAKLDSVTK